MSRAINLDLTHAEVLSALSKQDAAITSIELLFPRGTRVVLKNADQAVALRRALKSKIIDGPVNRTPLRTKRAH